MRGLAAFLCVLLAGCAFADALLTETAPNLLTLSDAELFELTILDMGNPMQTTPQKHNLREAEWTSLVKRISTDNPQDRYLAQVREHVAAGCRNVFFDANTSTMFPAPMPGATCLYDAPELQRADADRPDTCDIYFSRSLTQVGDSFLYEDKPGRVEELAWKRGETLYVLDRYGAKLSQKDLFRLHVKEQSATCLDVPRG